MSSNEHPDAALSHPLGPHLILTPDAGSLLDLMRDLGHVDEVSMRPIVEALAEGPTAARDPDGLVDLPTLRRAIAATLFEAAEGMNSEQTTLLEREWRLLFA